MLGRGLWHASHGWRVRQAGPQARATQHSTLPRSASAWLATLLEMRDSALEQRKSAVFVVKLALAFLTGTCNVERWLGRVALVELKQRAHKLRAFALEDAVKIQVQGLEGRLAEPLDPFKLLIADPEDSLAKSVVWRATPYCIKAQSVYKEFWGERRLPSRSFEAVSLADARSEKPRLGTIRPVSDRSEKARLRSHTTGVRGAIAAHESGLRQTVFGSGSGLEGSGFAAGAGLAQMVSSVASCAERRLEADGRFAECEQDRLLNHLLAM
jgi:hypothetical protein